MVSNSSGDLGQTLAGMCAVVEALPHPALVTDANGKIHCANAEAAHLLGGGCLTDSVLTPSAQVLRRLRRMSRSSVPYYLRLEFSDAPPVIFQGTLLRGADMRRHGMILLVADKASTLIEKFLNFKSDSRNARRELYRHRRRQQALRQEAEYLKRLSEMDPLTGLLNVRGFEARMRCELADGDGCAGFLVFIDLNKFKQLNDLYGHEAGDQALRHVADTLGRPGRGGAITARVGGDEFALWQPGGHVSACETVARLRAWISAPLTLIGRDGAQTRVRIEASMGTACCPQDGDRFDALMRVADRRMYADKAQLPTDTAHWPK